MRNIKVYFDTNVYSFISACNEVEDIYQLIHSLECILIASSENLVEMYAIPHEDIRKSEISALTTLATNYESHPKAWFHSKELRAEI